MFKIFYRLLMECCDFLVLTSIDSVRSEQMNVRTISIDEFNGISLSEPVKIVDDSLCDINQSFQRDCLP